MKLQIQEIEKRTPPFRKVVRVYRKDDVDATHYPIFPHIVFWVPMATVINGLIVRGLIIRTRSYG
jgi:phenylalanyl-tRNA synthetase alpha subunit